LIGGNLGKKKTGAVWPPGGKGPNRGFGAIPKRPGRPPRKGSPRKFFFSGFCAPNRRGHSVFIFRGQNQTLGHSKSEDVSQFSAGPNFNFTNFLCLPGGHGGKGAGGQTPTRGAGLCPSPPGLGGGGGAGLEDFLGNRWLRPGGRGLWGGGVSS